MKILVLGAGVIGVTTAYALGRQGHEVIVIDKEYSVASGASHANAGQLSYSYVDPFPNPEIVSKLPGYMFGRDNGIRIKQALRLSYYQWGLQFLRNCTSARAAKNMDVMLGLASQSMEATQKLLREIPDNLLTGNSAGKLILARNESDLADFEKPTLEKNARGFDVKIINRKECIKREPSLSTWQGEFCGGLFAKDEQTIDTLMLCRSLKTHSIQKFGVEYKLGQKIEKLVVQDQKISSVITDKSVFDCDMVVMCLGMGANAILKTVGKSCNIYPMRGYSLTLPQGSQTLKMSITDPLSKIVFANFGDKVRIAGFLDANFSESQIKSRGEALLQTAKRLWPEAADYNADPHLWAGYRPMTPSGVPIVEASSIEGLYYNMGHGSLGLTLAAGSAERIAKLVEQSKQERQIIKLEKNHAMAS